MENGVFSVPIETVGGNCVAMDGIALRTTSNSLVRNDSCDINDQRQSFGTYAALSASQGEPTHMTHQAAIVVPELPVPLITSLERSFTRGALPGNLCSLANGAFQEQVFGGMPIFGSARNSFQENLNNLAVPGSPICPFEILRTYVSDDALNSSSGSSADCVNVDAFCTANGKANLDRFHTLTGNMEIQPFSLTRNLDPDAWILPTHKNMNADNPDNAARFSNELSLSLTSTRPSVINDTSIPGRCSEISCSGITSSRQLKESRLGSEQASCASKELSLSCSSSFGAGQCSQAICGSKYLQVMQEILSEIAHFSAQNMEQMSFLSGGIKDAASNASFSTFYPTEGGMRLMDFDESDNAVSTFETPLDPIQQKRALEAKKMQLLSLLQVVDDRYNQCLDEMHTVISAFHAATELDPQIHTRFVLQTISFLYKSLRARISNQILAMGALYGSGCMNETDKSSGTSCFEEQWNLKQQLKKRDHQIWRPQRGLPERSVSVLRAWMFQNFLHPYPKDAEKHLLAIKSGLTRSQVSNWFINARVRLWKPMIEEMYAEMNRRKALQSQEGANTSERSQISISNPRF